MLEMWVGPGYDEPKDQIEALQLSLRNNKCLEADSDMQVT